MDREITSDIRHKRVIRRVGVIVTAFAAAAFLLAATVQWLRPGVRRSALRIARVERGPIEATLQSAGTAIPAVEQVVSSPVEARVLRVVRRAGDRVRAGDELVALDTSATRLDVDRLLERVHQKESALAELRLRIDEAAATITAQIEQKKLDREILRLRAEQNARMHAEGLVAKADSLVADTAARKGDIELAQLQAALARTRRTGDAQLASASSELVTARRELDESHRQLDLAMTRADRDGVLTFVVSEAGALVRRGDVVARVADLSSYRVVATISDAHASAIAAGQRVNVVVDDATTLAGTIATVDPRIEEGTMKFYVDLDAGTHPKLRNNLRVDVLVVTGGRRDALRVQRGSLGQAQREEVFVVRGDRLVRVPVQWGLAGQDYVEPLSGLRAGDEVVISDMTNYDGVKTLRLEER